MTEDVCQINVAAGTHVARRCPSDTETPEPIRGATQSDLPESQDDVFRFISGSVEHGISPSGIETFVVSSSQDPADAILEAPGVDLSALGVPGSASTQTEHRYRLFRSRLIATLIDEPIEDGVTHRAEGLIDEALRINSSECHDWLSEVLVEQYPIRPSISASIVRCIGRLDYEQVGGWGIRVVDDALRHSDAEVREAAIRGLEAWGGREALDMLRRHRDSVAWLNEYVAQVIVDLSDTTS